MHYTLGPLRQPGGRKTVEISDPLPPGSEVQATGPVEGVIELSNGGSAVSARGHLRVPVRAECRRCLVEFDYLIQVDVNDECALEQIDAPEAELAAAGKPGQIPILNEDRLDLSELVRQLVAMSAPSWPLCREDCAGLCATCGHDLNAGPCQCSDDEVDPRWAGLQDLKL